MGVLFCCPSCGASLRVTAEVAPLVSCPGCGEPIRVPRRPHPVETVNSVSSHPPAVLAAARSGLRLLILSLMLFVAAVGLAVIAFGLRVAYDPTGPGPLPTWYPTVVVGLAVVWVLAGVAASWVRLVGYTRCRPLAATMGVEAWAKAAAVGAGLAVCGVLAGVPWLIGRPLLHPTPELIAVMLAGQTSGLIGVGIEFAFLTVLHRLLWDTAGWREANRTSRYTVEFVFTVVLGMGCVCVAGMTTVMAVGGRTREPAAPVPPELKWIGLAVLASVAGCAGWMAWRYARILTTALRVIDQPEAHPPPVPHHRG